MAPLYPSFTPTYHHDVYPSISPLQFASSSARSLTILITGAGRGIGRAIALAFASTHPAGIALLGRTASTLSSTAEAIREVSPETDVFTTTADITSSSEVDAALGKIVEHYAGRAPDVLVQNAGGISGVGSTSSTSDIDAYWKAFELNTRGPLSVCNAFVRAADAEGDSRPRTIINISSGAAVLPYAPNAGSYAVSKLAMAKAVEYMHFERPEWRIFNLQPGVVDTELARAAGRKAPDKVELPAGMAVWLALSEKAKALNGRFVWANWDVDEMLERAEEIGEKGLLMVGLRGWAEEVGPEEMIRRARSVHRDADRKDE